MEIDYELVRKKARLAMGGKPDIVERSAKAFSYERNSQSPREDEEHLEIKIHTPEPEFVKRQWDIVNQLRAEVRFLSSKVNELRAKKSEKHTHIYKHK